MQLQVDLQEMRNRLRERQTVLMEQLDIESKKVLTTGNAGKDKADLAYDYAYRAHKESILNYLERQIEEIG